ncbi:MAG: hypothetical protein D6761_08895, partial [Candidatus Dadabacteria bacterium]
TFGYWAEVTATIPAWCAHADGWRQVLCDWDMEARSDSTATTIFVWMTHELLDLTMGDRLPGGRHSEFWRFIQDIPHFEQNVDWLLLRPATDPIWDLPGTVTRETKADTFSRALATAVASIEQQVGPPGPDWAWGTFRPFVLKHLFGGKKAIAGLVNSPAYPGRGLPNTVFKNQFNRADRKQMHVTAGPAMRINIDMADPEAAVYDLAGGESGWPESPYYANDVPNWLEGHMHPLSATDGETIILSPATP